MIIRGRVIFLILFLSLNNQVFSQINIEKFRADADSIGFSGVSDFDFLINTGNVDLQMIGFSGRLNYNWGNNYTFFVYKGDYGWKSNVQFSNEILFHVRNVFTLNEGMQVESYIQTDYNKSRHLLKRHLAGSGLRFKIHKENNFKIRYGLAYMYEYEKYDNIDFSLNSDQSYSNRISTYITFEIDLKKDLRLNSITYFQPRVGKWDDYRIVSENALSISLGKTVDLYIKFDLRKDNLPPDKVQSLDTRTKLGISIKY